MDQCTCPICDHEATYVRVYQHLQTGHRKSTLCRTLLEERADGRDPREEDPTTVDRSGDEPEERTDHRDPAIPQ
jgi:hypothetical protein